VRAKPHDPDTIGFPIIVSCYDTMMAIKQKGVRSKANKVGQTTNSKKTTTDQLTSMVMSKLEGCPSSPLMNISLEASTKNTRLSLPVILYSPVKDTGLFYLGNVLCYRALSEPVFWPIQSHMLKQMLMRVAQNTKLQHNSHLKLVTSNGHCYNMDDQFSGEEYDQISVIKGT